MRAFQFAFLALTTLSTVPGFASPAPANFACADLQKASQRLPGYAENIANVNTAKTSDGTPYRRIDFKCQDLYCETIHSEDFRLVYDPKNPDANSSGYIRLPRISVPQEFAAYNTAAAELRMLASQNLCGAKALISANSALIKYEATSSVQSDSFNFAVDGRILSWTRTGRDGIAKTTAFNADGTIAQ